MSVAQTFCDTVATGVAGTPYTVTRTARGFDLTLDLGDVRHHSAWSRAGLRAATTFHVRVDEPARTFSVLEERRVVAWRAGPGGALVPVAGAVAARTWGRTRGVRWRAVVDRDPRGRLRTRTARATVSQAERDLLTRVGTRLGLQERRSGVEAGALWSAAAVLGLLVLSGLATLAVLLLR